MRQLLQNDTIDIQKKEISLFSHFSEYVTGDLFSSVVTDSGTVAVGDALGGVVTLTPSDGTVADNDEAYLKGTIEKYLFSNDRPIWFGCRAKFTEANTDDANVILGIKDAVAANSVLDDGGGPAASYSGALFFKVDGGTVWWFETSLAGAQTTTQISDVAVAGDGVFRTFEIRVFPVNTTQQDVIPYINGVQCRDTNNNPIKHRMTYTSATEMQECAGIKNGFTNLETLLIDWIGCRQLL